MGLTVCFSLCVGLCVSLVFVLCVSVCYYNVSFSSHFSFGSWETIFTLNTTHTYMTINQRHERHERSIHMLQKPLKNICTTNHIQTCDGVMMSQNNWKCYIWRCAEVWRCYDIWTCDDSCRCYDLTIFGISEDVLVSRHVMLSGDICRCTDVGVPWCLEMWYLKIEWCLRMLWCLDMWWALEI